MTKHYFQKHGSVSAGGGGLSFSAEAKVSAETFKEESERREELGESTTSIRQGNKRSPEPIKITLTPITKFIYKSYLRVSDPATS